MTRLTPRIYLDIIKHLQRLPRPPSRAAFERRQMQQLEHFARQLGRTSPTRQAESHAALAQGQEDGGHVAVEGEGFVELVDAGGVRGRGLEGRRAVRVDPEGPQGVVEAEDDEAGEGLLVGEGCCWGWGGGGEGGAGGGGVEGAK